MHCGELSVTVIEKSTGVWNSDELKMVVMLVRSTTCCDVLLNESDNIPPTLALVQENSTLEMPLLKTALLPRSSSGTCLARNVLGRYNINDALMAGGLSYSKGNDQKMSIAQK